MNEAQTPILSHSVMCKESNEDDTKETLQTNKQRALTSLQVLLMILTSLRLNNSIQFLNTSSIRIGLKFVFLSLGSNVGENLLLSFKENPDLLMF